MKFATTTAALGALSMATLAAAKDSRTFSVLRFTNTGLTKGRMDPIVSPGKASGHAHVIMGGSNFGMSSTGEELMKSNCSNAMVKGDNSNYWVPPPYFHDPKTGEFESVDLFYMNVYYFFEPTHDDITAFPVGLSMMTGNATTRDPPAFGGGSNLDPSAGPIQPIQFTCPRSTYDPPSYPEGSNGSTAGIGDPVVLSAGAGFPDVNCDGYASPLRSDAHFPSCYNPDAGLTNYKENMAWPTDAGDGKADCPEGWIHTPHIFIEAYWNTPLFSDRWTPNEGVQPFVLSSGDATGFSYHADFMAAWDVDLLQHIIDTCNTGDSGMDTCAGLTYGLNTGSCTIESEVDEQVDGTLKALPGNNAVSGWGYGDDAGTGNSGSSGGEDETKATTDDVASTTSVETQETKATVSTTAVSAEQTTEGGVTDDKETVTTSSSPAVPTTTPCKSKGKVVTLWETITVTEAYPKPTQVNSKRDSARRHAHGHARRHRAMHE